MQSEAGRRKDGRVGGGMQRRNAALVTVAEEERRCRMGGGEKSRLGEKGRSSARGWKVHDQSLYFEITYFSISLINGAGLPARQKQGP